MMTTKKHSYLHCKQRDSTPVMIFTMFQILRSPGAARAAADRHAFGG